MALYNYIRPLWRNGPGTVDDAPRWVVAQIEQAVRSHSSGHRKALIHLDRDATNGVTIAWVRCKVSIQEGTSYRSAQFVHAIAADDADAADLTRERARQLLESVYTEPLIRGIAAQQKIFEQLSHPEDTEAVQGLFVGKDSMRRIVAATSQAAETIAPVTEPSAAAESSQASPLGLERTIPALPHPALRPREVAPLGEDLSPARPLESELPKPGAESQGSAESAMGVEDSSPPLSTLFTGSSPRPLPETRPPQPAPPAAAMNDTSSETPLPDSTQPVFNLSLGVPDLQPTEVSCTPLRLGPSRAAELAEARAVRRRGPRFQFRRSALALALMLTGLMAGLVVGSLLLTDDAPKSSRTALEYLSKGLERLPTQFFGVEESLALLRGEPASPNTDVASPTPAVSAAPESNGNRAWRLQPAAAAPVD